MYWWTNSSWNTLEHALKSLKKIFARKFTPKIILEKQFKFLMPFKITIWSFFYSLYVWFRLQDTGCTLNNVW